MEEIHITRTDDTATNRPL